ncbi:MAG: hypothetical protein WDZ51_00905 [Pirellulaceae bacterium]
MSYRSLSAKALATLLLVALATSAVQMTAWSQEAGEKPMAAPSRVQSTRSEPRGRLPNFYTRVVTPQQREQIYEIQQGFAEEIEALQAKLAAVEANMNQEIEGVLDTDQLQQVKKLQAEAAERRENRRRNRPMASAE